MKKHGGTWALVAITLAVVAYAYFIEFRQRNVDEEAKAKEALVIKSDVNTIRKITVENPSGRFSVEKKNDRWVLTEPVQDDVDAIQMNSFLSQLTSEKTEMEFTEEELDHSIYGLKDPIGVVEVLAEDEKKERVSVGTEAIQGKHYLKISDSNTVFVGSNQWKTLVQKNYKDLRSKEIIRDKNDEIIFVEVDVPGKQKVVLEKSENWIVQGAKFPLDQIAIKAFVNQIRNLRATDFAAENHKNLASFGLNSPKVVLRVKTQNQKDPKVIRFSTRGTDGFIAASDLKAVFKTHAGHGDSFIRKASDFRDKEEPFKFNLSDVIGVRTKGKLFDYRFIKKGEAWYLEEPSESKDVDQTELNHLLTSLQSTRAFEFLGKIPFTPRRHIELVNKDGDLILKIEVGDDAKDKTRKLIRTNRVDEIITVDKSLADSWPGSTLVKEKAKSDE